MTVGRLSKAQGDACLGSPIVLKEIEAGAALANCREARPGFCGKVLGQCLIGGRASVLSLGLPLLLSKSPHHAAKARGDENRPQLSVALTTPRLRALHRAEDIGSTLKRGVNVSSDNLSTKCSGLLLPQKYVIDEMRPDPPGCEAQGGPGLIIRPLRRRRR